MSHHFITSFKQRLSTSWVVCMVMSFGQQSMISASEAPTNSTVDFSTFQPIFERNIFNPNRTSRSSRRDRGVAEKPVVIESFTLQGTLAYEKGQFAFFGGSSSQFSKVLKKGDSIGGMVLSEIAQDHVLLGTNDQAIKLIVGMQMRKQDEGPWQLTTPARGVPSSTTSSTTAKEKAETVTTNEAEDEVVRRLMQKREAELKK